MEILLIVAGFFALLIGLLVYSAFSWGFVVMKLYAWFVLSIPALSKLPEFTFMQWVGLMLFIGVIKSHSSEGIKDEYKDSANKRFTMNALSPWIVLGVAWMLKTLFF